jgi:hypothetical protein
MVAVQLDVVAFTLVSALQALNEPVADPVLVKATAPAGALAVPAADESLTKAVQLTDWPTTTGAGEHTTDVLVDRGVTVTVLLVLGPLPLWTLSVGVYVALAMMVPVVLGVMVTEQLDVVAFTETNVHGDPVTDAVAVPVLVTAIVPAGAVDIPAPTVSLTNAVHVVDCVTTTEAGAHTIVVEVPRAVTVTVLLVTGPLLLWVPSVAV